MPKLLALIPARAGSQRVTNKNIRSLAGHPLIAYTIAATRACELFDRIVVSTDSDLIREIAIHYGADAPLLRPAELATSTSPDIEWITHALSELHQPYDAFSILRPTSPFRQPATIQRAWQQFLSQPEIDSLRAVELCRQHPGKMWVVEGPLMRPLLDQSHLAIPWHAGQYQDLPKVYVQNSSLEIAWTRVVWETNSREGKVVAPFFTKEVEGFSIDYEHDWYLAERLIETGEAVLPRVDQEPFGLAQTRWSTSA
ncbi:MAG: acylneuraminate cytidylyltransferase family protein [Candidatus Omnitrophica bacterium]|nr:acylneuraminate cytidylyltransferase family protein [Candidatus Omnitrophota bacterium]